MPSAIAAAEAVWAIRNRRVTRCGLEFRKIHRTATMSRNARAKPTSGDTTIGMTTLSRMTRQCTVTPAADPDARQRTDQRVRGRRRQAQPPGDEVPADRADHGRQHHDQALLPADPCLGAHVDDAAADGLATSVPSSAPSRLNAAAMSSATRGVSARVDTDVAMAFAASWKPLV